MEMGRYVIISLDLAEIKWKLNKHPQTLLKIPLYISLALLMDYAGPYFVMPAVSVALSCIRTPYVVTHT